MDKTEASGILFQSFLLLVSGRSFVMPPAVTRGMGQTPGSFEHEVDSTDDLSSLSWKNS